MGITPVEPGEISAAELARTVEADEPMQVVDVRAAFRLEVGKNECALGGS